jgi:hypothetical protein
LGNALARLMRLLSADPRERGRWTTLTGEDCGNPETLASLLLASALRENDSGIVLFSTIRPQRIRQATEAAQVSAVSAAEALAAALSPTGTYSESSSRKGSTR